MPTTTNPIATKIKQSGRAPEWILVEVEQILASLARADAYHTAYYESRLRAILFNLTNPD